MPYTIEEHKHRFAAWTASRAASVKGCRFTVISGKIFLESAGMQHIISSVENLPSSDEFDAAHRDWRKKIIQAAKENKLDLTHGVAAKLINIYLKTGFICSGHHKHPSVMAIHPPIDRVLLDELKIINYGNYGDVWAEARRIQWSKLDSAHYEKIIEHIRLAMKPKRALWEIEEHWQGHQ